MKAIVPALAALLVYAPSVPAQEVEPPPAPAPVCEETRTVFQDVSAIGRKDRAAANMTRRHAEMAKDGWRFADMEVYTENGDLEGFYLSYVRAVSCPAEPAGSG